MRFVQREGGWQLVDEGARGGERVIATLTREVEVVALARFCERYLGSPAGEVPSRFEVEHQGRTYRVYFLASKGEKLTLHIDGGGGEVLTVATEFML